MLEENSASESLLLLVQGGGGERAPKRSFEARSDNTIGRCMRVRTYHEQIVGGTGTLPEQGGGGMLRIVEHDKAKGSEHL